LKTKLAKPPIPDCDFISCTECGHKAATKASLKIHFERIDLPKQCLSSGLLLPNPCAFLAHDRYISLEPPLVCPSTGQNFGEDLTAFLDYVDVVSCHKWRKNLHLIQKEATDNSDENNNSAEDEVFLSMEEAVKHQLSRIRQYYQCPKSNMAFKLKSELKSYYSKTQEGKLKEKEIKTIFRCPYSEKIYKSKSDAEKDIKLNFQPKLVGGYEYNGHLFISKPELNRFMREKGSDKSKAIGRVRMFQCPLCEIDGEKVDDRKTFKFESEFIQHLNEFHNGME